MELIFKQLVDSYNANLQDTLRNFSVGPDFLDTWVHDEDETKSVFGIFDAAEVANLGEPLTVVLDKKTATQIDGKWLLIQLNEIGEVMVSEGPDTVKYKVTFKAKSANRKVALTEKKQTTLKKEVAKDTIPQAFQKRVKFQTAEGEITTHPIYQKALTHAAKSLKHGLKDGGKLEGAFEAQDAGVSLHLVVSPNGSITGAHHSGAQGLNKILLDRYCAEILSVPLQEAAEHGAIRTEFHLRDLEAERPVEGIAQTGNIEPAFQILEKLTRAILHQWLEKTGKHTERNFWTDPVPASWYQLATDVRVKKIQEILDQACLELGAQPIQVIDLKNEVRAVIQDEQKPGFPPYHLSLLKLESILKQNMGFSVELLLEDRADKNKRQLSRTEEPEISLN